MSSETKRKQAQCAYQVLVRGRVPEDLGRRVSALHAMAIALSRAQRNEGDETASLQSHAPDAVNKGDSKSL